jgi:hypothetical protein
LCKIFKLVAEGEYLFWVFVRNIHILDMIAERIAQGLEPQVLFRSRLIRDSRKVYNKTGSSERHSMIVVLAE